MFTDLFSFHNSILVAVAFHAWPSACLTSWLVQPFSHPCCSMKFALIWCTVTKNRVKPSILLETDTPLKINMEHKYGGLEDHFPFFSWVICRFRVHLTGNSWYLNFYQWKGILPHRIQALIMLWRQLGLPVLAGICCMFAMLAAQISISKYAIKSSQMCVWGNGHKIHAGFNRCWSQMIQQCLLHLVVVYCWYCMILFNLTYDMIWYDMVLVRYGTIWYVYIVYMFGYPACILWALVSLMPSH